MSGFGRRDLHAEREFERGRDPRPAAAESFGVEGSCPLFLIMKPSKAIGRRRHDAGRDGLMVRTLSLIWRLKRGFYFGDGTAVAGATGQHSRRGAWDPELCR